MMPLTCLIIETVFRTNERIFEKPHTCISSIVLLMICKYAWSCPSPSHHHSSLIPNSVAAQRSLFLSDKFVLLCVYFIEVTVYRVTLPRTQYTCHEGCQGGVARTSRARALESQGISPNFTVIKFQWSLNIFIEMCSLVLLI